MYAVALCYVESRAAKRISSMHELRIGEHDLTSYLTPDSFIGAVLYFAIFVLIALLAARALRAAVHAAMVRQGHMDRTTISFLQQIGTAAIWVVALILYAHLIPVLRSMGTALLTGASIASVVIGLAAQSTLGNLIAGVAITIYRPFRLGDTLQVAAPSGSEVGTVEVITLGYTMLRTGEGRLVVLPNSVAASQVTVNLGDSRSTAPLSVVIRVDRHGDVDAARELALRVARETVGEARVLACLLTRIEAKRAVLELRVRAPDPAEREALHSKLMAALAREFAQAGLDSKDTERAAFS
jgi:small conductance mechanosensitive channel